MAAVDLAGIIIDGIAIATPGVPGGVGLGIKAGREGVKASVKSAAKSADDVSAGTVSIVAKDGTKPLLGKNPTPGKNKKRTNTELEGGTATAKSIFRNQTKGQNITQSPLGPNGGVRRVAEDGTAIRIPSTGGGARVDLPGRGLKGQETVHFKP